VARVKSRSFSEKDIIAKVTFDNRPSQANAQKRAFREKIDQFVRSVGGSAYTDITGGLIQARSSSTRPAPDEDHPDLLRHAGGARQGDDPRRRPIKLKNIRVVALNVVSSRPTTSTRGATWGGWKPGRSASKAPALRNGASSTTSSASIDARQELDPTSSAVEARARAVEGLAHRRQASSAPR